MTKHFEPRVWVEDDVPGNALNYVNCEVCSQKSRIIWGEGNPQGKVAIVLDNPGEREDKTGQEYVCGTRQTLQTGLHRVGISAEDVYLTYLLKCRPLRGYDKDRARSFSLPFLIRQIAEINPKLVLYLGDVVVQTILGDKDAHVKDLRGKTHHVMGYRAVISYHPLAVRRRPNLGKYFLEDLEMVKMRL